MPRVELREVTTGEDRRALLGLRRGPGQDAYLDSMEEIFLEAEEEARAMPRQWAVHEAETGNLVGFTMISDGIPEPIDDGPGGPVLPVEAAHRRTRAGAGLRRRNDWRDRRLPSDASRRRCPLYELCRRARLSSRLLPRLRVRGHGPRHVGRERPRPGPARGPRCSAPQPVDASAGGLGNLGS